jgi:hypothetical protein
LEWIPQNSIELLNYEWFKAKNYIKGIIRMGKSTEKEFYSLYHSSDDSYTWMGKSDEIKLWNLYFQNINLLK